MIERAQRHVLRHELARCVRAVFELRGQLRALRVNLFASLRETLDDGVGGVFLCNRTILGEYSEVRGGLRLESVRTARTFMASCCLRALRLNSSRSCSTVRLHSSNSTLYCCT